MARLLGSERRASLATMARRRRDAAGACALTRAALVEQRAMRVGAFAAATPSRNLAVDRTRVQRARAHRGDWLSRARLAAVPRVRHGASALLRANAARPGAGAPRSPCANRAIDGAFVRRALLLLLQRGARCAAVLGQFCDDAHARSFAETARLRARVAVPGGHLAVLRAVDVSAGAALRQRLARRSTIAGLPCDSARARLRAASAARFCARPPR